MLAYKNTVFQSTVVSTLDGEAPYNISSVFYVRKTISDINMARAKPHFNAYNFLVSWLVSLGQIAFGYPASIIAVTLAQPSYLAYMYLIDSQENIQVMLITHWCYIRSVLDRLKSDLRGGCRAETRIGRSMHQCLRR